MSSVTMDTSQRVISKSVPGLESGKILGMRLANERRGHNVMSSLIGWAHKQNDHCEWISPVFLARNVCVSKKQQQPRSPILINWTTYMESSQ